MAEKDDKGFVIRDRRFVSRQSEEEKAEPDRTREPGATVDDQAADQATRQAEEASRKQAEETGAGPLPEVNFATFVVSLSSSVLVHLGEIEDPQSGRKTKNLPIAKQTIDILGMLEEKTRGNLSPDEEQLLRNVLYDLRMRYVREVG
ncbi:MAG: DUF1844 domain-containing protein [Deltaproteobacteria bacterium]|nr:DUF1844 domain-containing protein [Deltaproteobacteria bacterium]